MKPAIDLINQHRKILVIQAENPDADSLASSLALEELLSDLGKEVHMFCRVNIPGYLRYLAGWDRVTDQIPAEFDISIIVDTSAAALLEKTLSESGAAISKRPCIVIDHHTADVDLPFETHNVLSAEAVATGEVIAKMAESAGWSINQSAAGFIAASILSDSLGLVSPKTTADSVQILADMVRKGANLAQLDEQRKALSKKTWEIFQYKGKLFERVELHLDGRLATVHVPWDEIEAYSDAYNPAMLIIDEMRQIEGVMVAVVLKTYPEGKLTAKLRSNPGADFMDDLAGHFGGGGHPMAAGFKVYNISYDQLMQELIQQTLNRLEG